MTQYRVRVTGEIWMGGKAATEVSYFAESREDALQNAHSQMGDFSKVDDYAVDEENACSHGRWGWTEIKEFDTEEGEMQYQDCMYPEEE